VRDIKNDSQQKEKHERNNYMKRKIKIITSAFVASLLAFSALAQETLTPQTDKNATINQRLNG